MKFALVLSVLFVSTLVHAQAQNEANFADQKAKMVEHISAQMTALENTKKCIEAANDRDAVKKCHEQAKAERQKFQGQRIDDQIKKLEEKKKALEEKKK